ncbi:aminopeptidase N C-terminal domain-containing protein, partial [Pseudomonadota bacterium]
VAARLAGAFTQWRRYDYHRQSLMRTQLEAIAAYDSLSNDVAEIAHKTLQS